MKLSALIIKSVNNLLSSNQGKVKLDSSLGRFLLDYQDLARVDEISGHMFFNASQKHQLQTQLYQDHGKAIWGVDVTNKSRLDVAKIHANEKLAGVGPDAQFVLIKSRSGNLSELLSSGMQTVLPLGTSLRCSLSELLIKNIECLIVVENLAAFDAIHTAMLPEQLNSALFVYRGHDRLAKGCQSLLNLVHEQSPNTPLIAFCDYDPDGLKIALTLPHVSQFIYPELNSQQGGELNTVEDYLHQSSAMHYLQKHHNQPGCVIASHISKLRADKLSIKQEHMLAHKLPLMLSEVF